MEYFSIKGGKRLEGTVSLAGSKNLASKLMIASLLSSEPCTITNVPEIGENQLAMDLVQLTGASATRDGTTVTINAPTITQTDLSDGPSNRLPILIISPLLFRTGEAIVPEPGGDKIGRRPVNFHVDLLTQFGAAVHVADGLYHATANRLVGTTIDLPYPSVGATETALMCAVWAEGESSIAGAAIEPEVQELVGYLNAMGADISLNDRTYTVQGVQSFHAASQRVIPDRLEAVSYATLAVATHGSVLLEHAKAEHLTAFMRMMEQAGAGVEQLEDGIRFSYQEPLKAVTITTGVHPGFMSDWQQPTAVMLLTAEGESAIHETVYEHRFGYVDQLISMGASIRVEAAASNLGLPPFELHEETQIAYLLGPAKLQGTTLTMPDLRAGMAYIIAALVAEGQSTVYGIEQVDRGYEQIVEKLQALGAEIERKVE